MDRLTPGLYVQVCCFIVTRKAQLRFCVEQLVIGSMTSVKTVPLTKRKQALGRPCNYVPCLSAVAFWNEVPFDEIPPDLLLQTSLSPLRMSAAVLIRNSHVAPGVSVRVILGAGGRAMRTPRVLCLGTLLAVCRMSALLASPSLF